MEHTLDHTNLHRTAKYFMDSGRAATYGEALVLLERFGLTIMVGEEVATSADHQAALLTLINTARRTLLGGIVICGIPDCASLTSLASPHLRFLDAIRAFGGVVAKTPRRDWPAAVIGTVNTTDKFPATWQVTWEGWRGGVVPAVRNVRLKETGAMALAPILAAAICAGEAFAFHASDHPMADKRSAGLSLWHLGRDWLASDSNEPTLAYLPTRLWIIGLGNLGQAFAWLLASLPYKQRGEVQLVLQDFDRIAASNDSTSLLSFLRDVGRRKARVVADWLDALGFETFLEERFFGPWTNRSWQEPGVALCGVDNAEARAAVEDVGFDLVVEVGLGAGPQSFRSMSLHTFPASRAAKDIWQPKKTDALPNFEAMPAYRALESEGMDKCGLTQLASRTVGVPFVGLIAACLGIAEILRRLNGGIALEFAAGSVAAIEDFEFGAMEGSVYSHGHTDAKKY